MRVKVTTGKYKDHIGTVIDGKPCGKFNGNPLFNVVVVSKGNDHFLALTESQFERIQ